MKSLEWLIIDLCFTHLMIFKIYLRLNGFSLKSGSGFKCGGFKCGGGTYAG